MNIKHVYAQDKRKVSSQNTVLSCTYLIIAKKLCETCEPYIAAHEFEFSIAVN